jgi:DNA uptake protein ComE-like DNA-binding protein
MKLRSLLIAVLALAVLMTPALSAQSAKRAPAAEKTAAGAVDLNTASEKELDALPGVGPATAKKIIEHRPYGSVNDLFKAGISAKEIDNIRPMVTAGGGRVAAPAPAEVRRETKRASAESNASGPIDLNTASEKELDALPGVGPATAKKIIDRRPYGSVDDLAKAGISAKEAEKLKPLVTVRSSAALPPPSRSAPVPQATRTAPSTTASVTPPPAGSGMVWVNTDTKVYHREGDRWYGKTKHGQYMSEADAERAGNRAAKK